MAEYVGIRIIGCHCICFQSISSSIPLENMSFRISINIGTDA